LAQKRANRHCALQMFGDEATALRQLARFVIARKK
jgi:hypothetical protein